MNDDKEITLIALKVIGSSLSPADDLRHDVKLSNQGKVIGAGGGSSDLAKDKECDL